MSKQVIYAIGLGPGAADLLTPRAARAIAQCDVIAGYNAYLKQFPELFNGKKIIGNGMRGEIERCNLALKEAACGKTVGVISSGDAGIYAMAGLLLELVNAEGMDIEVVSIPGVTAASAAACILGAPLMNDFAVISLSDLLTPRQIIVKRLKAVAAGDMVCALYNPSSTRRKSLIREAVEIFMEAHGGDCYCGIVKDASRPGETATVCQLCNFPFDSIDMTTIVITGNSQTLFENGKLFTKRGYIEKYGK
ncbi:precorrin-3B C(17)-methyltransferase [Lentisphaerota bacterium ZTH]|nr:precorrin-3B C(17)-methyltransferase [Lentisphaerota bacterium]WET07543.1 precorrin-3B C(17)-methyltransferase [Lentisphaerota bacterium ZTH]